MRIDQYNFYVRSRGKKKALVLSYKDPETGEWKQVSKSGFTRVSEAKAESVKKELLERVKLKPRTLPLGSITFREFAAMWIEDGSPRWAANTVITYRRCLSFFSALNDVPMERIKYTDLLRCLNTAQNRGYSAATVNSCVTTVRALFGSAVSDYNIVEKNPAVKLKRVRRSSDGETLKTITEAEAKAMLAALKETNLRIYTICMIGLYAGLRHGEILGLTWDAIDLNAGTISVTRQWSAVSEEKGYRHYGFKRLKTENSRRTVPIPPVLIKALTEYREYASVLSIDGRLFPHANTSNATNFAIARYCPGRSAHSMRHTYATTLLFKGMDVQTVAALLGDTVQMVITTYTHYVDEMRKNAAESVAKIFG